MRFSTFAASAIFGAVAVSAAETATITDLSIRDNNGIQAASFKISSADNVECSSTSAADLANSAVVVCGESKYRFAISGSNSKYDLTLYKEVAVGAGITGKTTVQPYCHAGGNGQNDFVCSQVGDISVELSS
ncbi:putative major allergen alt [Neofusicoccum parvum]|uniref:AA1-like domain-containing protein n=2 Tax=Neofusicoccum TaxID=407951 RepID=A0ABR3SFL7_9PEZI|nr:putative major allergen alt [Neofusicoccum parvum UCRNP2]GME44991.1 putative major allergen alt [Neofusicoccum parvum]